MHDIRAIREKPAEFDTALRRRNEKPIAANVLKLDEKRRAAILLAETTQASQKQAAKEIALAKASGDHEKFENLRKVVSEKKALATKLQKKVKTLNSKLDNMLAHIPNLPAEDVPDGDDENDNVEIKRWGNKPEFKFHPKEHYEISGAAASMNFETAAKIAGARFVMLIGSVARLHRALAQFMLDQHVTKNGLTEVNPPVLVNSAAMYGTDKLPKFGGDSYTTKDGRWLIPTSEVPLSYIPANQIVDEVSLPLRFTAHTVCFRSEAGAAGKDTTGMLRQHQFEKVEMVSITNSFESDKEQQRMLRCAEDLMEQLCLPYRTMALCAADLGFGARRTYDIEVWLPGQNAYREISSVSTTGDFQARRMNARYRPNGGGKPQFLHTLNGSGLAVGRCLIAVLENGQQADGSVHLPQVLTPYLNGATVLNATGKLT
ncbi:MAG: serine--tRNA ligase [Aestuariivita sp.]|nr:serine--tRNA ligase [Aestuariivita sp.]